MCLSVVNDTENTRKSKHSLMNNEINSLLRESFKSSSLCPKRERGALSYFCEGQTGQMMHSCWELSCFSRILEYEGQISGPQFPSVPIPLGEEEMEDTTQPCKAEKKATTALKPGSEQGKCKRYTQKKKQAAGKKETGGGGSNSITSVSLFRTESQS